MRTRSAFGPWWLLVLLAFGVVAMHRAPIAHAGGGGASPPGTPAVSAAHHSVGPNQPVSASKGGDTATHAPLVSAGDKPGMDHGLLHQCLAVLAGSAAVVIALLALRILPATASLRSLIPTGVGAPDLHCPFLDDLQCCAFFDWENPPPATDHGDCCGNVLRLKKK